jgi:uncharacterized protein YifE (UPF0438 family)
MKILVSITTTNKDYLSKIKELQKFNIKEVALFFTLFAKKNIREKIYKELLKANIKSVPVIHLRNDMKLDEIEYLIKTFKTKKFNTHPMGFFEIEDKELLKKHKNKIYIENIEIAPIDEEIKNYAGICLDVSHLHDSYLKKWTNYKKTINLLKNYKCGFAHVSAIKNHIYYNKHSKEMEYADHDFNNVNEFDYLKKYKKYLPKYLALEINNDIKSQLQAKKYIQKLLK